MLIKTKSKADRPWWYLSFLYDKLYIINKFILNFYELFKGCGIHNLINLNKDHWAHILRVLIVGSIIFGPYITVCVSPLPILAACPSWLGDFFFFPFFLIALIYLYYKLFVEVYKYLDTLYIIKKLNSK